MSGEKRIPEKDKVFHSVRFALTGACFMGSGKRPSFEEGHLRRRECDEKKASRRNPVRLLIRDKKGEEVIFRSREGEIDAKSKRFG